MSIGHVSRGSTAWRWRKLRHVILARNNGRCEDCNIRPAVEVHHILDQHEHPERALDPTNLLALCTVCHNVRTSRQRQGQGQSHQHPTRQSRQW